MFKLKKYRVVKFPTPLGLTAICHAPTWLGRLTRAKPIWALRVDSSEQGPFMLNVPDRSVLMVPGVEITIDLSGVVYANVNRQAGSRYTVTYQVIGGINLRRRLHIVDENEYSTQILTPKGQTLNVTEAPAE